MCIGSPAVAVLTYVAPLAVVADEVLLQRDEVSFIKSL
jgi:hypothetical protein